MTARSGCATLPGTGTDVASAKAQGTRSPSQGHLFPHIVFDMNLTKEPSEVGGAQGTQVGRGSAAQALLISQSLPELWWLLAMLPAPRTQILQQASLQGVAR